jgi:GNAT superfamily N-acetyltransferase
VELQPVEDRAALEVWHEIVADSLTSDYLALPPDPLEERLPLLDGSVPEAGERLLFRLGVVSGEPVAAVELALPTLDNLTAASIDVHVPPGLRRKGFGRQVLAEALDETAALERSRVFFEAPSPLPTGAGPADALLQSVGARPVLKEVRRLLDLHDPLAAQPSPPEPPAGYRLVQWIDRVPDEHVDGMAYLMHRMSTDAPLEDMDWEPERWDAARYRQKEDSAIGRGRIRVATLAVHEATGSAVGFTDIGVSRFAPETAYQWETIVDPSHRGHGLGYVLKAHNHRKLADTSPATRWVNTWNAESNTHMIAINEQLGFKPVEYWTEWQLDR